MPDREKVIKGLECAIDPDHFGFKNCHDCFYRKDVDHLQYVCDGDRCISDALALLKEQEPVEPVVDIDTWKCGNCGHTLEHQELLGDNVLFHEQYNYCPECGRPVKWDG